jgi:hypothetical protein
MHERHARHDQRRYPRNQVLASFLTSRPTHPKRSCSCPFPLPLPFPSSLSLIIYFCSMLMNSGLSEVSVACTACLWLQRCAALSNRILLLFSLPCLRVSQRVIVARPCDCVCDPPCRPWRVLTWGAGAARCSSCVRAGRRCGNGQIELWKR